METRNALQPQSGSNSYDKGSRFESTELCESSSNSKAKVNNDISQSAGCLCQNRGKAHGPIQILQESDISEVVPSEIMATVSSRKSNERFGYDRARECRNFHTDRSRLETPSENDDFRLRPSKELVSDAEGFTLDTRMSTGLSLSECCPRLDVSLVKCIPMETQKRDDRAYLSTALITLTEPQSSQTLPSVQNQTYERNSVRKKNRISSNVQPSKIEASESIDQYSSLTQPESISKVGRSFQKQVDAARRDKSHEGLGASKLLNALAMTSILEKSNSIPASETHNSDGPLVQNTALPAPNAHDELLIHPLQNADNPFTLGSENQACGHVDGSSLLRVITSGISDCNVRHSGVPLPLQIDHTDAALLMSTRLQQPVAYRPGYEIMDPFSNMDMSRVFQVSGESRPVQTASGNISSSQDCETARPDAVPEPLIASFAPSKYASEAKSIDQNVSIPWTAASSLSAQKRKRARKPNLSQINRVRAVGACILCRLQHDRVRPLYTKGKNPSTDYNAVRPW